MISNKSLQSVLIVIFVQGFSAPVCAEDKGAAFTIISTNIQTRDRGGEQGDVFAAIDIDMEIKTHCSGPYSIDVELQSPDGQKISTRPMYEYASAVNNPSLQFTAQEGEEKRTIRFSFSGEDIRRAGVDGVYRVKVANWPFPELQCPETVDRGAALWVTTPDYRAADFGEYCGSSKPARTCADVYE